MKIIEFLTAVLVAGLLTACNPELFEDVSDATVLIRTEEYRDRVDNLLLRSQNRLSASNTVLSVYDDSYSYRIIYASTSETPTDPGRVSSDTVGYTELFYESRDGNATFNLTADLPKSNLRSRLEAVNITSYSTAPVLDKDGFLLGFFAATWTGETLERADWSEEYIKTTMGDIASEITELSDYIP